MSWLVSGFLKAGGRKIVALPHLYVDNGPQLDKHDLVSHPPSRQNKILIGGSPVFVEKAAEG